jgi:uncharacterized protein (TIGR02145 family)
MKKTFTKHLLICVLLIILALGTTKNSLAQGLTLSETTTASSTRNVPIGNQHLQVRINTVQFENDTYFSLDGLGFRAWMLPNNRNAGIFFTHEGRLPKSRQNIDNFDGLDGAISRYIDLYRRGYRPDPKNILIPMINRNIGAFTDQRDGRIYKWVKIGDQTWMAENLAFLPRVNKIEDRLLPIRYNVFGFNGNDINIANNSTNYKTYGTLYSWIAATIACPQGWHLPSDAEWKQLESTIGMTIPNVDEITDREGVVNGNQLKAPYGWEGLDNAFNPFGFTALPGGVFDPDQFIGDDLDLDRNRVFIGENTGCVFWTKTEFNDGEAWIRSFFFDQDERNLNTEITRVTTQKRVGASVRCVRDE